MSNAIFSKYDRISNLFLENIFWKICFFGKKGGKYFLIFRKLMKFKNKISDFFIKNIDQKKTVFIIILIIEIQDLVI